MIKISSKWNYIGVGVAVMAALLGATLHSFFLVGFNIILTWINWTAAEIKYQEEIQNAKNSTNEDEE